MASLIVRASQTWPLPLLPSSVVSPSLRAPPRARPAAFQLAAVRSDSRQPPTPAVPPLCSPGRLPHVARPSSEPGAALARRSAGEEWRALSSPFSGPALPLAGPRLPGPTPHTPPSQAPGRPPRRGAVQARAEAGRAPAASDLAQSPQVIEQLRQTQFSRDEASLRRQAVWQGGRPPSAGPARPLPAGCRPLPLHAGLTLLHPRRPRRLPAACSAASTRPATPSSRRRGREGASRRRCVTSATYPCPHVMRVCCPGRTVACRMRSWCCTCGLPAAALRCQLRGCQPPARPNRLPRPTPPLDTCRCAACPCTSCCR